MDKRSNQTMTLGLVREDSLGEDILVVKWLMNLKINIIIKEEIQDPKKDNNKLVI